MKIDAGQEATTSCVGGILSLILFGVIIIFALQKADILINKKDVDILSTVNDKYFDADHVFNHENGFAFAAAFTGYDGNSEPILEPEYGEIVFNHYIWGPQPDGSYTSERKRIQSHTCTSEELGLADDDDDGDHDQRKRKNPLFLPVYPSSYDEVKFYSKKMQCASREDYMIYGDFNSYKGSQFNV